MQPDDDAHHAAVAERARRVCLDLSDECIATRMRVVESLTETMGDDHLLHGYPLRVWSKALSAEAEMRFHLHQYRRRRELCA